MSEQFLHSMNVVAIFQPVKGVAKGVAGGVLVDIGLPDGVCRRNTLGLFGSIGEISASHGASALF